MKRNVGSVRMGPISLVSLVIVLCLAVMCMLSVTTARAMYYSSERQASSTTDVYLCEQAGQKFLANVDGVLASVREGYDSEGEASENGASEADKWVLDEAAGTGESSDSVAIEDQTVETTSVRSACLAALRDTGDALVDGFDELGISSAYSIAENDAAYPSITATFVTESDRRLSISLAINDDGTYRILSWKTTTFWNNNISTDTLWSGETTD